MRLFSLSGQVPDQSNANPALRALALRQMIIGAPILELLEFYTMQGSAANLPKNSTASGGTFRALNDEYSDNKQTPSTSPVALVAFGDIVQTDIAYQRRGFSIEGQRVQDIERFALNMGKNFQYQLINANGTSGAFTGLLQYATDNSRTTAFNDTLGTDAKVEALMRKLTELIEDVSANFLVMPVGLAAFLSIRRSSGVSYMPVGDTGTFMYQYAGVPIIKAGANADGVASLPWSNGNAGKIIVGKTAEAMDITVATNVGLQVLDQGVTGTAYKTLVEMDAAPVLQEPKSLWVITDVTYTA